MQLEIQSRNFYVTQDVSGQVRRRVDDSLKQFEHAVKRVTVRITEEDQATAGASTLCEIIVKLKGPGVVLTRAKNSTAPEAVDSAATQISESVAQMMKTPRTRRLRYLRAQKRYRKSTSNDPVTV